MSSRTTPAALAAGLALAAVAAACTTGAPGSQRQTSAGAAGRCFYARNISSWSAGADRQTVNLRVGVSDYYQLKLLGDCLNIDWTQAIGVEHRGSDWICSGLDATLIVPQSGGGRPLHCAASSLRRLTPEEAAALPPRQKP